MVILDVKALIYREYKDISNIYLNLRNWLRN